MSVVASQITSVSIVYLNVCSGAEQRKRQSSASLAFVRGIHWWPVNSPHKGPVTRNMFHLMTSSWYAKFPPLWFMQFSKNGSGAHFTNNFSITIQMWWKFHFALIQILIKWSLQYLAHGTTAGLSWHVPNFYCDVIISNWIRAKWNFHHIWIVMEKSLVKWVPDPLMGNLGKGNQEKYGTKCHHNKPSFSFDYSWWIWLWLRGPRFILSTESM